MELLLGGLAVAAALEDLTYDAEALAWDLAELRAGERVSASARSSSRLGACCRLTYRSLTAPGYLRDGLPERNVRGAIPVLQEPVKLSRTPLTIRRRAPKLGEHTDDILKELGYTAQDIEKLKADRVV